MIVRKKSVVIAELYSDEVPDRIVADVIRYHQWRTPMPGLRCSPFHTILIDLSKDETDLLAQMDKGTRYEIRRAEQDALLTESLEGTRVEQELPEFCDFYDRSAALTALPPMDRAWLAAMARAEELVLTRVQQSHAVLAWHAYHRSRLTAVLLYTMSVHRESSDPVFRQLVGRANRYLHWQDLVGFSQMGVATLDMGGWYGGSEDQRLLEINKFKEAFGGTVSEIYNSMIGVTLKGKLAVWYIHRKT